MVISASVTGTGAVKRPSSALQDDCPGWETAPPMGMSMPASFNLPFAHYAMIYLDNMGKLMVSESPSIREQNGTVFSPEVRERFLEILGSKIGYRKPMLHRFPAMAHGIPYAHPADLHHHGKRRKVSVQDSALDMPYADPFSDPTEEFPHYPTTNMTGLEIGDTDKVMDYYENALKHFQQLNCRQVAKAFIKFIEPRKQVKHPYNGGRPKAGAGEKGDPEKTKPEWWPAGVVHKEPDHLKKDQRIRLLIHIIRKLGRFGITPDKLQEVAHDAKRQLKPNKMEVLDEIFRVRRLEERYERGEVDASMMIYVINRDANTKGDKDSDTVSEPDQKLEPEDLDDVEDDFVPPSSAEQTGSFSSMDSMPMASQPRPVHMGAERNQLFPLPDSLSFGEQSRPYNAAPEYSDEYTSPPLLKTSSSSTLVSPNEQPAAFDYLAQPPFPTSAPGEQHMMSHRPGVPMHYDAWTPPFRQNMFNPMEYGAAPSQTIQPSLYQMPLMHDMSQPAHGLRRSSLNHYPHMMAAHHPTSA